MKKIISIVIIAILILIIKNLFFSIYNLSNNSNIVGNLEEKLKEEKKENLFLKQKLSYVKSDEFVENQARNILGLVTEGEYIVIAPKPEEKKDKVVKKEPPNWEKWWKLFF